MPFNIERALRLFKATQDSAPLEGQVIEVSLTDQTSPPLERTVARVNDLESNPFEPLWIGR